MAIVVVLFFFIVFAMLDYGWAFSIRENMIHSAQEGLRTALVTGTTDQGCAAKAAARQRMVGVIGATRAGTMNSTFPCPDPTADLTVSTLTASCAGTTGTTSCMTVTMSYPYGKDSLVAIPGYPELVPQTITITATERLS